MSTAASHSLVRMHVRTEHKPKEGPEAPTTEWRAVAIGLRAVPTAGAARKGLLQANSSLIRRTPASPITRWTKMAGWKLGSLEAYGSNLEDAAAR